MPAENIAGVNETTHQLADRVAIVTGASRGIGKAIARCLVTRGAAVAICARNQKDIEATGKELSEIQGARLLFDACDVRDEKSIASFVQKVKVEYGRVDILVNNAGIYKTQAVLNHPKEVWTEVLETNLTGSMLFCREVLSTMIENNWGRIINISSVSGRTGEIWASAYSASKFGLIGLTQSLALEVATQGITVNAICPGWVATDMSVKQLEDPSWCKLNSMDSDDAISNACFAVPQNRFIEPDEVASLVAFLASDQAKGITGQSLNICGGLSLQ